MDGGRWTVERWGGEDVGMVASHSDTTIYSTASERAKSESYGGKEKAERRKWGQSCNYDVQQADHAHKAVRSYARIPQSLLFHSLLTRLSRFLLKLACL